MFTDWVHWLSSLPPDQLLSTFWGLLLVDGMRYSFSKVLMCLYDFVRDTWRIIQGRDLEEPYTYCPSVAVIVAGYNEGEIIESTLQTLWGTYPRLEFVVTDDGSLDDMAERARRFARHHSGVLVLSRPRRSGKASATNFALQYTRAEVIVVVDADSEFGPDAIWRIVQPLKDPSVGAVSGTILGRRPFDNLVTWLQSFEYLSSIFVGRMLAARLGILGIVSGAFGAFRRGALEAVKGWDAGPPEDLDLTLAIRKSGYDVACAPYAICYTDMPNTWYALGRQRLRWDQSGVIRNHCRKHLDLAFFWTKGFRFSNLVMVLETWFTTIFCLIGIWMWFAWQAFRCDVEVWHLFLTLYFAYCAFEGLQALTVLYYSDAKLRDALVCSVVPFVPFYQFFLMIIRTWALSREIFFRRSHEDNYVPIHIREATFRW